MPDINVFTQQELDVSADIINHVMRIVVSDMPFLQKAVYSLKPQPTDMTSSICADYERLYYNPSWAIEKYRKSVIKLRDCIVHCVLHSLLLHPSITTEQDKDYDTAADFAVFGMMAYADLLNYSTEVKITELMKNYSASSVGELYELSQKDVKAFSKMYSIVSKLKEDDHSLWYLKPEGQPQANQTGDNVQQDSSTQEQSWSKLLADAKLSAKSVGIGSMHENMFMEIKKPDRFSRFDYLEYIRRFARQEIVSEDPDTIDMMMYIWGMENLGNTPIVEFSEVREQCTATDIIIAIDMSGSCGGEVAENFLRQILTLFEQMNIRSAVNVHVVAFDTELLFTKIIRTKMDVLHFFDDYEESGWGGTDFRCVFNYADEFAKNNNGKRLKGLFFFSDGYGFFPDDKPSYRTTFFIPKDENSGEYFEPSNVPDWVELVRYTD